MKIGYFLLLMLLLKVLNIRCIAHISSLIVSDKLSAKS